MEQLTSDPGGVTLYVRLPEDAPPISALNFASGYGGMPKTWTMSGSVDGGETWVVLHSATNFSPRSSAEETWIDAAEKGFGDPVPKAFPFDSGDPSVVRPSACSRSAVPAGIRACTSPRTARRAGGRC